MGYKVQTLPANLGILLLHLFFLLLLLEQALLVLTVEEPLVFLAKLEAAVIVAITPSNCSILESEAPILIIPTFFFLPAYSLSSANPTQLFCYTIVQ